MKDAPILLVLTSVLACSTAGSVTQAQPMATRDEAGQQADSRVPIPQNVTRGLLIMKVNPKYPADLRRKHIQGTVILRAEIGVDGAIHNLALISGEPSLAKSAMKAVRQWKYKPYLVNGQPKAVETEITVNFALDPD